VELGSFCQRRGIVKKGNAGLSDLCLILFQKSLWKEDRVRCGDWETEKLDPDQVKYSALDAYASLEVYRKASTFTEVGLCGTDIPLGSEVFVMSPDGQRVIAEGRLDTIFKTGRIVKATVAVEKVLVPAALPTISAKSSLDEMGNVPFRLDVRASQVTTLTPADEATSDENTNFDFSNYDDTTIDASASGTGLMDEEVEEFDDIEEEDGELIFDDETLLEALDNDLGPSVDSASSSSQRDKQSEESLEAMLKLIIEPLETSVPDVAHSRVLGDIFHVLKTPLVGKKHSLSKDFMRAFRDAFMAWDPRDRAKLEVVLKKKGMTWEEACRKKPHYVLKRVRRWIPPPRILLPRVSAVFSTFGPLLCSKTKLPVFNAESWKQAANILHSIKLGYLSDPFDVPIYVKVGLDRDGLQVYRCIRGTNSVEGGVHRHVHRKFNSYNAGPQLSNALLLDYRARQVLDVGIKNRTGRKYRGHYNFGLKDALHAMYLKLQLDLPASLAKWTNTSLFQDATSSAGIATISEEMKQKYGMDNFQEIEVATKRAKRAIVKSPNGYVYVASKQQTKYAVVGVHTIEEKILFSKLMADSKRTNLKQMTLEFNKRADGKTIFYKLPDHLGSHLKAWRKSQYEKSAIQLAGKPRKDLVAKLKEVIKTSPILKAMTPPATLLPEPNSSDSTSDSSAPDLPTIQATAVPLPTQLQYGSAPTLTSFMQRPYATAASLPTHMQPPYATGASLPNALQPPYGVAASRFSTSSQLTSASWSVPLQPQYHTATSSQPPYGYNNIPRANTSFAPYQHRPPLPPPTSGNRYWPYRVPQSAPYSSLYNLVPAYSTSLYNSAPAYPNVYKPPVIAASSSSTWSAAGPSDTQSHAQPQKQRQPRHCGVCKSSTCPGRGAKKLCKERREN
jgi:hypothetical protein